MTADASIRLNFSVANTKNSFKSWHVVQGKRNACTVRILNCAFNQGCTSTCCTLHLLLLRQLHSSYQVFKARVVPERIHERVNTQPGNTPVARDIRFFQLFESLVLFTQRDVNRGDFICTHELPGAKFTMLSDYFQGLTLAARLGIGITQNWS